MKIELRDNSDAPLYRQIVDAVREAVRSGAIEQGERLEGHRTMARSLGVNPLTVRRAYELLESEGVVARRPGSGTYVQAARGGLIDTIVMVIGQPSLAACTRELSHRIVEIVTGMMDVLGEVRFMFREHFTHEQIDAQGLGDGTAVVVFSPFYKQDSILHGELERRGVPVVGVWGDPSGMEMPHVRYDPHEASRLACEHLIACGYRRLGFIGEMGKHVMMGAKFFMFADVLYRAGLDFQVRHVRDVKSKPTLAYRAVREIVEDDVPEAFFVDCDVNAMEVVRGLEDAGLRVPEDVGVVGYGDISDVWDFEPGLTTVRAPRREVGREAGRLLLGWGPGSAKKRTITLKSELVVRETTIDCGVGVSEEPSLLPGVVE